MEKGEGESKHLGAKRPVQRWEFTKENKKKKKKENTLSTKKATMKRKRKNVNGQETNERKQALDQESKI